MKQFARDRVGLLLMCVVCGLAVFVASSYQEESLGVDPDAYRAVMLDRVADIQDLQDFYFAQREDYLPILPPDPDFILTQPGYPSVLPFNPKDFPSDFTDSLVPDYENSVPVFPVTIIEDFLTRETVFLNADGKEIYALPAPKDYNPYVYLDDRYPSLFPTCYDSEITDYLESLYDPARIEIQVRMVDVADVEPWLYAQMRVLSLEDEGGGMMLMRSGYSDTNINFEACTLESNGLNYVIGYPDAFTNRLEIYICTNLVDSWWALATTGTNTITWVDETGGEAGVSNVAYCFAAGNADLDTDKDGLADAREILVHHTDLSLPDTDGDGVSDGDEVAAGTDPLDKYSAPALPMLKAQGENLVDTNGNAVVLRSVNVGGWLAWEQWMMGYQPKPFTNNMGVADSNMDEAKAREMLVDRVDTGLTLYASQASASNGVTNGSSYVYWSLCPANVKFAGNFGNNDWVCFSNKNFGSGMSNLAIGLAVPVYNAGKQIKVCLGSSTGTVIGILTTRSTSPDLKDWDEWCVFSEQYLTLSTNLSGNQTIYFVGSAGSGDIANLFRFRFYNSDTNTRSLYTTFRDNYFTTNDLDTIRSLGYNCIRLPFYYNVLEDDDNPYLYKTSGWVRLDWALSECAKRRIWVILDMHGTPGGLNPFHSCGMSDPFRNRLWSSDYYKDRTEKLWAAIASRYATNPAVAGYDLMNEPYPPMTNTDLNVCFRQAFSNDVLPMLDRLYKAVRSNDTSHLVIMEGDQMYTNMWGDLGWWPTPGSMNWSNVCYEFHVYDQIQYGGNSTNDWWFSTQKRICDNMVRAFTGFRNKYQVPIFIGEFAPYNDWNFDYWTRQMNANGMHWAHWNYRTWGWDSPYEPGKGRTLWGLDYRSKATTNDGPRLMTDSLSELQRKFSLYSATNYDDNAPLQDVVKLNAGNTNVPKERCAFYLNTFSGPDAYNVTSSWCWAMCEAVGLSDRFWISGGKMRLYTDRGSLLVRERSREEADARFEINDSVGCHFSVDPITFYVTNTLVRTQAEVRLSIVRDSLNKPAYQSDTIGIVARMLVDQDSGGTNTLSLSLHAKGDGTNTYGEQLASYGPLAFVTGGTLAVWVTATNAVLSYNGTNYCAGTHTNLALVSWPNGAVCALEVAEASTGTTWYADLDNLKAWKDNVPATTNYSEAFTNYAVGVALLAKPERLAVRDWSPNDDWDNSLATNGNVKWIPEYKTEGWTYLNPRTEYQNAIRLQISATNTVDIQANLTDFSKGNCKLAFLPEYFPGNAPVQYAGPTLYVSATYTNGSVKFDFVRQWDRYTNTCQVIASATNSYVPGQVISFQMGAYTSRVYYGTNALIEAGNGTNALEVYANGVFPHLEFQNTKTTSNATVTLQRMSSRRLAGFSAP